MNLIGGLRRNARSKSFGLEIAMLFALEWRYQAWLLKNSSSGSAHKFHRTRMPYKRLSRLGWTFSIPKSAAVFSESDFFNTHRPKPVYRPLGKEINRSE
jgi:hypothetical protein